jgi:hypothetical protein
MEQLVLELIILVFQAHRSNKLLASIDTDQFQNQNVDGTHHNKTFLRSGL